MANRENSSSNLSEMIDKFNEIMANNQKDMLDNMNRANRGELFVLHYLSTCSSAVLPSELSVALQSSTGRISALLSSLEKKGEIERDVDRSNRRNVLVTITEAGRNRAKTEMKEIDDKLAQVFIDMGDKDAAEFLRLAELFFGLMQKHMTKGVDSG